MLMKRGQGEQTGGEKWCKTREEIEKPECANPFLSRLQGHRSAVQKRSVCITYSSALRADLNLWQATTLHQYLLREIKSFQKTGPFWNICLFPQSLLDHFCQYQLLMRWIKMIETFIEPKIIKLPAKTAYWVKIYHGGGVIVVAVWSWYFIYAPFTETNQSSLIHFF